MICMGWLSCEISDEEESIFSMDSLNVPTSPETHLVAHGAQTELWEVILVASCPIVFIVFLCLCVVCLVFRSYERPLAQNVQRIRHHSQIASILRQLPPPPKYDIAVTSVDAPPPVYTDIGKDINTPLRTTPNGARPMMHGRQFQNMHHLTTPTVQPLNIQYLYPPKYEETPSKVEHVVVEIDGRATSSS
ncbi:unnamed protein product [Caenorhabditis angaria]|uniref:Uncharacterized protein n=1 Tax=Caenorhabditis angaria TaxID=860376 RepID=A0A9P1IP20_9PELO|nr:unnamed protein product [Caenorhabditis angaria]